MRFTTTFASFEEALRAVPELIAQHLAESKRLHEKGDLVMAGAFLEAQQGLEMMAVLVSDEAARAFIAGDPLNGAGYVTEVQSRHWANMFA